MIEFGNFTCNISRNFVEIFHVSWGSSRQKIQHSYCVYIKFLVFLSVRQKIQAFPWKFSIFPRFFSRIFPILITFNSLFIVIQILGLGPVVLFSFYPENFDLHTFGGPPSTERSRRRGKICQKEGFDTQPRYFLISLEAACFIKGPCTILEIQWKALVFGALFDMDWAEYSEE